MATEVFGGERKTTVTVFPSTVLTGRGRLVRILFGGDVPSQVDVYDDPTGVTNRIWSRAAPAIGDTYELDCPVANGIRVVVSGADVTAEITFVYSGN